MNIRKKALFCAVFCITVCFSYISVTQAQDSASQKMVKLLPDDVMFFAETSGGDALKPDFEKSILGQIWNDPDVKSFYQSVETKIMGQTQAIPNIPDAADIISIAQNVVSLAGSRPIIIGAAQKKTENGPPVYGFAFLDAGSKKEQIDTFIKSLEEKAGDEIVEVKIGSNNFHGPKDAGDVPGYWGWVGNYFVFGINDGDGLAIKYLQGNTERELPSYFLKSSITNDALGIYINIEKAFSLAKSIAKMEGEDKNFALIETVIGKLGFDKIKSVTSRVGFSGSDVVGDELIEIPTPLTGLLANMKPISLDMFNMASSDAISISAINCDVAGIYDTVFDAIKSAAGNNFQEIEQGIAEMENQTQVKIREGLLASLNGKMLFYQTPVNSSSPYGGYVAVIGLKDVQLWNDSISTLSKLAVSMSNDMVQASSQEIKGRMLNTIAIAPLAAVQIMPTWTIVGDNVVIGSSPAICSAAAEQAAPAARANSIRNNESFQKATVNLPSNMLSLQYVDSRAQMVQIMAALQQYWPVATMYLSRMGIKDLPMVLPDLSNVIKDITPSIQYTYLDEKGIHSIYKGSGVEIGVAAVAGGAAGAIGAAVFMPVMPSSKVQAQEVVSRNNLKQLALASIMYADDHNSKFAENIEQLNDYLGDKKTLESPLKPSGFNGPSYIYVSGHSMKEKKPSDSVLIYENPQYCSDQINTAFFDGHVEKLTRQEFLEKLKATYEELGKPMPEIKFED